MKKLKLNNFLFCFLSGCLCGTPIWAGLATGGDYTLTKDILYASGSDATAVQDYDIGFTWGEQTAGKVMTNGDWELFPGYYGGGRLGNGNSIRVLQTIVAPGMTPLYQDSLQVGVPLNASITIKFSDQLDSATVPSGVQMFKLQDHLGTLESQIISINTSLDSQLQTVTVTPSAAWEGNTLYALIISAAVHSLSGYSVDPETQVLYLTVLNPKQENLLLQSTNGAGSLSANAVVSQGGITLHIPVDTLADYAAIITSKDPLNAPLRVDSKIIDEANRKAQSASAYRIPLVTREMTGYDSQGHSLTRLSKPAQLTLGMKDATTAVAAVMPWIRPQTLSLWVLDEDHHLWLKIPGSSVLPDGSGVTASVTSLSVFALMGEAAGSASDVFVFPVPWRPHGPQAGNGPGETGTENGGITFGNLPSECTIKIFTLSGELVRTVTHSDLSGSVARETWDVKTTHGQSVASGVYFWRVESNTDSKNGKLVVIR